MLFRLTEDLPVLNRSGDDSSLFPAERPFWRTLSGGCHRNRQDTSLHGNVPFASIRCCSCRCVQFVDVCGEGNFTREFFEK